MADFDVVKVRSHGAPTQWAALPLQARRECIGNMLAVLAAGAAQAWAPERIPELEAVGSLSAIAFVVCRRLAAIEAARSARVAALPKAQRVQYRRGGAPAPSAAAVMELSSGYGHVLRRSGRLT